MNQRLKLYTFDNYYEYEWLWCDDNTNTYILDRSISLLGTCTSITKNDEAKKRLMVWVYGA